jgi:hypothetical protein
VKAYAVLCGSKGDPSSQQKWYQIFFDQPSQGSLGWRGPYRDKTDAENAAHEEAKRRGLELEWTD